MSVCVLDASFAFQWLFEDEASAEGDAVLDLVSARGAVVPELWQFEMVNGLGMAERRGRLTTSGLQEAVNLVRSLPLTVDSSGQMLLAGALLDLMRAHRLTAYDATYLEAARRLGLPLATKDGHLRAAATVIGVALMPSPA